MEILLSLLRTLIFVVATVAATVYVSRRIGRGRSLLWTGTTLHALYWLVLFGWTAYLAGSTAPNTELGVWVGWSGHLLPFFATIAYIVGVGQAAGFPSRFGAGAGASMGKGDPQATPPAADLDPGTERQPATAIRVPTAPVSRFAAPTSSALPSTALPWTGSGAAATSDATAAAGPVPPSVGTPTEPAATSTGGTDQPTGGPASRPGGRQTGRSKWSSQPFPGPHAVPVVTTPSASSHLSPSEPPSPTRSDGQDSPKPPLG